MAIFIRTRCHFRIVRRINKNSTQAFSKWRGCFHFTPHWLYQEFCSDCDKHQVLPLALIWRLWVHSSNHLSSFLFFKKPPIFTLFPWDLSQMDKWSKSNEYYIIINILVGLWGCTTAIHNPSMLIIQIIIFKKSAVQNQDCYLQNPILVGHSSQPSLTDSNDNFVNHMLRS